MKNPDTLSRFVFEDLGVRGQVVKLKDSWNAATEDRSYPNTIKEVFGHALSAVVLLSSTLKFKGSLIMQAQGNGAIKILVAQSSHLREIKGLARWDEEVKTNNLQSIFGEGKLVMTIKTDHSEPYQGVVPLVGNSLSEAIENYFSKSEQLRTRLWLFANERMAGGLLLQQLPAQDRSDDDWERVEMLADTLTKSELLYLSTEEIITRLFHEEKIRLFEPEPVVFRCHCSAEKIESTLVALDEQTLKEIYESQETLSVHCEFCNQEYKFDKVDLGLLLKDAFKLHPNKPDYLDKRH